MDALIKLAEAAKGMSARDIFGFVALLLVALSAFIEITPIKINPISAFMRWIGKAINGPVLKELASQKETMVELRDVVDDNEIDRIRWEILDFANSCRQGKKHTLDEFVHIIELNEKYHKILDRRDLTNGRIDLEYHFIEKIYKECQEKNNFL